MPSFRFQLDNDYFDFWLESHHRPDDNYTGGEGVRFVFNGVPVWARHGQPVCDTARSNTGGDRCVQSFISAMQQIFTPTHDSPAPIVGERPYAGLLYADFGMLTIDARQLRSLSVRLGTSGYPSGAEAAQKAFHRISTQRRPLGWDYQISAEPIVGVSYGRQYLLAPNRPAYNRSLQLIGSGGALLSHLQSEIHGGLEMRAGLHLPHPWITAPESAVGGLHAYVIVGGTEQWVARNLVLEGNSPETRNLVTKRPFVSQVVVGFAVGLHRYYLEYRAVGFSNEYEPGPGWRRWGSLSFIRGTP